MWIVNLTKRLHPGPQAKPFASGHVNPHELPLFRPRNIPVPLRMASQGRPSGCRGGKKNIFTSAREDDAMVELGVGKNMVRSIRFWAEAAGVLETTDTGHVLTDFGSRLSAAA